MKKARLIFYLSLALIYPIFFLLHWNGMFSITYYWALVLVDGTRSFLPQLVFSFVSAALILGVIFLFFEIPVRIIQRRRMP